MSLVNAVQGELFLSHSHFGCNTLPPPTLQIQLSTPPPLHDFNVQPPPPLLKNEIQHVLCSTELFRDKKQGSQMNRYATYWSPIIGGSVP